ncbi:MAG: serine hydrolase domain-containing protein [Bacteroidota bacterium]
MKERITQELRKYTSAIVFLLLLSPVLCWGQMRQNLITEIDKILYYDVELDYDKVPGFMIGIIVGDSTFVLSYGSTNRDSAVPPTDHTLYELGGMTKVFSATLVKQLADQELMHFDSSLNRYLPPAQRNEACDHITIGSLLTHTSGLPKMPFDFGSRETIDNNPYAFYTHDDLLEFYQEYGGTEGFGQYNYSNVGFALLGLAVEYVTGLSYEKALVQYVLQPFGLKNTAVQLDSLKARQLAQGYTAGRKATPPWAFQSFAASEGLKSDVIDLLQFLRSNIDTHHQKLALLHQRRQPTLLTRNTYIATGWHSIKNKKYYDVILHPGNTSGYHSFMAFVKETRTGIVILSNSEHGLNSLGYLIMRMLNNNWKKRK